MRLLTCAIHQPNLFPRLSTLAKLYAADVWIVLDDVQFNHRDYDRPVKEQARWLGKSVRIEPLDPRRDRRDHVVARKDPPGLGR